MAEKQDVNAWILLSQMTYQTESPVTGKMGKFAQIVKGRVRAIFVMKKVGQ